MEITLQEFIKRYGNIELFDYEITDTEVRVTSKIEITGQADGFKLPGFAEAKQLEILLNGRKIVMIVSQVKKDGVLSGIRIGRI